MVEAPEITQPDKNVRFATKPFRARVEAGSWSVVEWLSVVGGLDYLTALGTNGFIKTG
jgi:hypothetical protein